MNQSKYYRLLLLVLFFLSLGKEIVKITNDLTLLQHGEGHNFLNFEEKGSYVILSLVYVCFGLLCVCLSNFFSLRLANRLHRRMMQYVSMTAWRSNQKQSSEDLTQCSSRDMGIISFQIPALVNEVADSAGLIAASLSFILYESPEMVIPLVLLAYYFLHSYRRYSYAAIRVRSLSADSRNQVLEALKNIINGAGTIQSLRQSDYFVARFKQAILQLHHSQYALHVLNRWQSVRFEFCGAIMVVVLAIVIFAVRSSVSVVVAGLLLTNGLLLTQFLKSIFRVSSQTETALHSVVRLLSYTQNEFPSVLSNTKIDQKWLQNGRIRFESVWISYSGRDEAILKDINLEIREGEKVALLGKSGAGKTTLFKTMLNMLAPIEGTITVGGKSSIDFNEEMISQTIGVVCQSPVILPGSLQENLDPTGKFSKEEIESVKEKFGLLSISDREKIDDFWLNRLSMGERQLISLARLYLRRTKIILTDEMSAFLDKQAEDRVRDILLREFSESTVISITHRLNSVVGYDRILEIRDGRVHS